MELARRAAAILTEGAQDPPARRPRRLTSAECERRWRRWVLWLLRVCAVAEHTSVLQRLDQQAAEANALADARCLRAQTASPPQNRKASNKKGKSAFKPVHRGDELAASKSVRGKPFPRDPKDCQHPPDAMEERANANLAWWTCSLCGSRWERTSERVEQVITAPAIACDDIRQKPAPLCKTCSGGTELRRDPATDQAYWGCKAFPRCRWACKPEVDVRIMMVKAPKSPRPTGLPANLVIALDEDEDIETQAELTHEAQVEELMSTGLTKAQAIQQLVQNMTSLDQVQRWLEWWLQNSDELHGLEEPSNSSTRRASA